MSAFQLTVGRGRVTGIILLVSELSVVGAETVKAAASDGLPRYTNLSKVKMVAVLGA